MYEILINHRLTSEYSDYLKERVKQKYSLSSNISYQYIEKINKQHINTIYDCGFCNGLNFIAFEKFLPNLKTVFAFEPIYEYCINPIIEPFLKNNQKLCIVPYAVSDKEGQTSFIINTKGISASFVKESRKIINDNSYYKESIVDVTTIDVFYNKKQIKPDLIKMDIEGGELFALKGGLQTIQKCRPQLAISIYHSLEDFTNIPIYLSENLKDYTFKLGHYGSNLTETVLYAIPNELT